MKKKIALLALMAIFAAIAASSTIAYFTSETTAHNVITSGGIDIEIVETMKLADGTVVDFPSEEFKEENKDNPENIPELPPVMPGTSMSKIVKVKNIQEQSWIRAWVNIGISDETNQKNLLLQVPGADGNPVDVVSFELGEGWVQGEDYYYYYTEPVDTWVEGEEVGFTTPLFEKVDFAKEMGNEYQNCKVIIDVEAEAIQTANNPMVNGEITSVWPEYKEIIN